MPDLFPSWLAPLAFTLFGACIGSFLNVAIYRTPLGLALGDPARSFCPSCKTPIPWYLNMPVISWMALRGRCANCKARISVRYWIVEVLTAGLFLAVALGYDNTPVVTRALICLWMAVAVVVAFIDAEHMHVFPKQTMIGTFFALLAAISYPLLVNGEPDSWTEGFTYSALGAAGGFVLIRLVIELGKLLFGSWKKSYDKNAVWRLEEPASDQDELALVLPDRTCVWSDLFARRNDKAVLKDATLVIDGKTVATDSVTIREQTIETSTGESFSIEEIESASGTLGQIRADREAMGAGDAWIMMMIGALCGWEGSVFSLIAGSFLGIVVALAGRLGLGRTLPFGPCLLAGAVLWLFFGKQLWFLYLNWINY